MYAIKKTPFYFGGTCNAPQESLITESDISESPQSMDNDIIEYETEEEAQQVIDEELRTEDIYYLSHGEAELTSTTLVPTAYLRQP